MKTKSVLIIFAMLFIGTVMPDGEAATDLVINEISPVAPEGGFAWIEFFNPTRNEVALAGSVVETADGVSFEVPGSVPALRSGGFLLIRFGPGSPGVEEEEGPPHLIVVTAPARFAQDWQPFRGEFMIKRPPLTPSEHADLVDYVAWGDRGLEWSRIPSRLAIWKEPWFVSVFEGFGIGDRAARIPPGSSIGLYPGSVKDTPEDWVNYDSDEASPGEENHVPRPKAFTLPDGAEIGGQSFAVGWASRKGDEGYHFQMAADPDFDRIIVDERTVTPGIRIGEVLPEGRYFYRVRALSAEKVSTSSRIMSVFLFLTSCDWPLPPFPWFSNPLDKWMRNPDCKSLPDCEILPSIEFRFQRKDTNLVCLSCSSGPSYCSWDHPHPRSQRVCFSVDSGRPCYDLTAGGAISKTCTQYFYLVQFTATGLSTYLLPAACWHGENYCVMASLSMLASAYRTCLSQDRIAFVYKGITPNHLGDLLHGGGDGPSCGTTDGGTCSKLMRWALGIPEADFVANPVTVPTDSSFTAAYLPGTGSGPVVDFNAVRTWIDAGRPIMSKLLTGRHMRVVAGYCDEGSGGSRWLFIFDPKSGPHAEKFESWYANTAGIWVGPAPAGNWAPDAVPHAVRWDEIGVWGDWDKDGLKDFDEARRFGLCPFRNYTTSGTADKNRTQLPGLAPTAIDPCDIP